MTRLGELIREEDERAAELSSLLARLGPDHIAEPGYDGEWSVKDLVAHLGCWQARAASNVECLRLGTYVREPDRSAEEHRKWLDELSRSYYEAWKDRPWNDVRAEWWSSRNRMLEEMSRLQEPSEEAEEWFRSELIEHYDSHLPRLREWVDELTR